MYHAKSWPNISPYCCQSLLFTFCCESTLLGYTFFTPKVFLYQIYTTSIYYAYFNKPLNSDHSLNMVFLNWLVCVW